MDLHVRTVDRVCKHADEERGHGTAAHTHGEKKTRFVVHVCLFSFSFLEKTKKNSSPFWSLVLVLRANVLEFHIFKKLRHLFQITILSSFLSTPKGTMPSTKKALVAAEALVSQSGKNDMHSWVALEDLKC